MLNNDHIHVLEQKMRDAIKMGLTKDGHENSSVKCFPTFVRELPNGKENGKSLEQMKNHVSVEYVKKTSFKFFPNYGPQNGALLRLFNRRKERTYVNI